MVCKLIYCDFISKHPVTVRFEDDFRFGTSSELKEKNNKYEPGPQFHTRIGLN